MSAPAPDGPGTRWMAVPRICATSAALLLLLLLPAVPPDAEAMAAQGFAHVVEAGRPPTGQQWWLGVNGFWVPGGGGRQSMLEVSVANLLQEVRGCTHDDVNSTTLVLPDGIANVGLERVARTAATGLNISGTGCPIRISCARKWSSERVQRRFHVNNRLKTDDLIRRRRHHVAAVLAAILALPRASVASTCAVVADTVPSVLLSLVARDVYGNVRDTAGDTVRAQVLHVEREGLAANTPVTHAWDLDLLEPRDLRRAEYQVMMSAVFAGEYSIQVDINGDPVPLSHSTVNVLPAALHLPSCNISGGVGVIAAGVHGFVHVDGRDRFGNLRHRSDGVYRADFRTDPGGGLALSVSTSVLDASKPGSHGCVYNLTAAGRYNMQVYHLGVVLPESPGLLAARYGSDLAVVVVAASTSARSSELWPQNPMITAGELARATVQLRDAYGNPRSANVDGVESASIGVWLGSATLPPFFLERPDLDPWKVLPDCTTVPCQPTGIAENGSYTIEYRFWAWLRYELNATVGDEYLGTGGVSLLQTGPAERPRAVSAQFEDSLVRIRVEFSADTNMARMGASSDCRLLFDESFTNLLGRGPTCRWKSLRTLLIALGYRSSVTTTSAAAASLARDPDAYLQEYGVWDGNLTLTSSMLLADMENSAPVYDSLVIDGPDQPLVPVARITAPLQIGECEGLSISGSNSYGGGPRPLRYEWTSLGHANQNLPTLDKTLGEHLSEINARVDSESGQTGQPDINLVRNDTVVGSLYSFRLMVSNFLGEYAFDQVTIRKLNISVPNVALMAGDQLEVMRTSTLLMQGSAALASPDCVPPEWRVMGYDWSQQMNGAPLLTMTEKMRANKDLYLSANTLEAYYTYAFQLDAFPQVLRTASNFARAEVYVLPEPLSAAIAGGNRIVGRDTALTLDAGISVDPSAVPVPMEFKWACTMSYKASTVAKLNRTEGSCVDTLDRVLKFTNEAVQRIEADTLFGFPGDGLPHYFTVVIEKVSNISGIYDVRNASASVTLFVVPGQPPQVGIAALPQAKVNAEKRLILKGSITSRSPWTINKVQWYATRGFIDLSDPQTTTTGRYGKDGSPNVNLVINAGSLIPGQEYRFRLYGSDEDGDGFSESNFIVNTAPASGLLLVEPVQGTALNTTFLAKMDGWADDPIDLPLVYRFSYLLLSEGTENIIGNYAESDSMEMILPTGDDLNGTIDYHVVIVGYVQDRFGASAQSQFTVSVRPPNVTGAAEMGSFAEGTLDAVCSSYMELGYIEKYAACIGATVNLVNRATDESDGRRRLSEEDMAKKAQLRDKFVDGMVNLESFKTPTDVNTRSSLDMAASVTSAVGELSANATDRSLNLVSGIVGRVDSLGPQEGGTTTKALSNVATAWNRAGNDDAYNGTSPAQQRRNIVLGLSSSCQNDCSGHGNCTEFGDCECDDGVCSPGACIRHAYPRENGTCYSKEDECTDTQCHEYVCRPGFCRRGDGANCYEGKCRVRAGVELDCHLGPCVSGAEFSGLPALNADCSRPDDRLQVERQQKREDNCTSATLLGAAGGLSQAVLADRVTGEDSVDLVSDMINSSSVRVASDAAVDPDAAFSTPGESGLTLGIPTTLFDSGADIVSGGANCTHDFNCSVPQGICMNGTCVCRELFFGPNCSEAKPPNPDVDIKATSFGSNLYKFDASSAGMVVPAISSIELSGNGVPSNSTEPFIIGIPTSVTVGGHPCTNGTDCTAPQGLCINGSCVCSVPYTGARCTDRAICKFWNVASESFDDEGCVVDAVSSTRVTCKCTHLTDFASFEEEWLPQMNFVNPFDAAILDAFMADPRNIVVFALILSIYCFWVYATVWGYHKDKAERHQHYMQQISTRFGGSVNKWAGAPNQQIAVVLPDDSEMKNHSKEIREQELRRQKRRLKKLKRRMAEEKLRGARADQDMLKELKRQINELKIGEKEPNPGSACLRYVRRFCAYCGDAFPRLKHAISQAHPWLSCVFVNADDRFTRPQRLCVLMCVIFGTIALEAFFMEGSRCLPGDPGYPECENYNGCMEQCEDPEEEPATNTTWQYDRTARSTEPTWENTTQPVSFASCMQLCLATVDDAPEPPEETPDVRKIITTAIIVSVLMMPADRLFVAMFEKVTTPRSDAYARGSGGRVWTLPALRDGNKQAVMRIQAVFRGRIARKRSEVQRQRMGRAGGGGGLVRGAKVAQLLDESPEPPRLPAQRMFGSAPASRSAADGKHSQPITDTGPAPTSAEAPLSSVDTSDQPETTAVTQAGGGGDGDDGGDGGGIGQWLHDAPDPPPPPPPPPPAGTAMVVAAGDAFTAAESDLEPPMPRGIARGHKRRRYPKNKTVKALEGLTVAYRTKKLAERVNAAHAASQISLEKSSSIALTQPPPPPPPALGLRGPKRRPFPTQLAAIRPAVHSYETDESMDHFDLAGLDAAMVRTFVRLQASWRGTKCRRELRQQWADSRAHKAHRRAHIRRSIRIAGQVALSTTGRARAVRRGRRRRFIEHKMLKDDEEEEDENFPRWFLAVAYASCIIWCFMCGIYSAAVCVYFGPVQSLEWLYSVAGATGFEGLVQDPIKIGAAVVVADQAELLIDLAMELKDALPF